MKPGILLYGLLLSAVFISSAQAGGRPQLTRIIAYANDKETPVEIVNDSSEGYMVQSWLEDLNGSDANIPLVLTPPVMKLNAQQQGKLRLIVMKGAIPQDRESVYWLSIQEIPPKAKNSVNRLVVAVRSRLKVFVRPQGLNTNGSREAVKQLRWSVVQADGKRWLKATNPSPYYISFGELSVGRKQSKATRLADKNRMVPPLGSERYLLPADMNNGNVTVTWSGMNDWGGADKEQTQDVSL